MKTLKLSKAWTYRTPVKTIVYPAGDHEVTNEIYDAAVKDGAVTEDKTDGGRTATTGAKGAADKAEG